jgi:hypothetical protein
VIRIILEIHQFIIFIQIVDPTNTRCVKPVIPTSIAPVAGILLASTFKEVISLFCANPSPAETTPI